MLFRLVRPIRRKDSRNGYFQQRIPADVRPHAIGRTLEFQVGGETVSVRVTERSAIIKLSLRSSDPVEVKLGQAEATRQAELHWKALRQTAPVTLTHRHCVALAGRAYEAWTANSRRETTTAMEHVPDGEAKPGEAATKHRWQPAVPSHLPVEQQDLRTGSPWKADPEPTGSMRKRTLAQAVEPAAGGQPRVQATICLRQRK
jgi:hypothetical protein